MRTWGDRLRDAEQPQLATPGRAWKTRSAKPAAFCRRAQKMDFWCVVFFTAGARVGWKYFLSSLAALFSTRGVSPGLRYNGGGRDQPLFSRAITVAMMAARAVTRTQESRAGFFGAEKLPAVTDLGGAVGKDGAFGGVK